MTNGASIGAVNVVSGLRLFGKTRIICCANENFSSYYGVEIETGFFNNYLHLIRGRSIVDVLKAPTSAYVDLNHVVKVKFRPPGLMSVFLNGSEIAVIPAPPTGLRHWGVVSGIDGPIAQGVQLTSVTARDL